MKRKTQVNTYSRQDIDANDIESVLAALESDIITGGDYVEKFESKLSEKLHAEAAVSCSSCTAALHLASMAAGVSEGDFVIVPSVTFGATANIPRLMGAEIIFADVSQHSGLMTPETFKEAIKKCPQTPKVVYPVHLSGQACEMDDIYQIAHKDGIKIIEDAAHALGAKFKGRYIGASADSFATCFSFHPVKPITMGEGGAVTISDKSLATKLAKLRSHGIEREPENFKNSHLARDETGTLSPWYYEFQNIGLNYRASDINCALGLSQLSRLDTFLTKRRRLAKLYDLLLEDMKDLVTPIQRGEPKEDSFHLYPVHIALKSLKLTKAQLIEKLRSKGIGTQVHYIPVHLQPYYSNRYGHQNLPQSETYYENVLSLPLHTKLTESDIEYITSTLYQMLVACRRG